MRLVIGDMPLGYLKINVVRQNKSICYLFGVIVQVRVVFRKSVVGD